jgi:serine/threonine-protein kinase RsbW
MIVIKPTADTAIAEEDFATSDNHRVIARKEFVFSGDLQSVAESRQQVMQSVREYCNDEADEIDLTVALQEALANAALHGCKNDSSKSIHCLVEVELSKISLVVRDPGPGFDFEHVADPNHFDATTLEHGRGIALMRGLMDEVTFSRGGSEVRLAKSMKCRSASPKS